MIINNFNKLSLYFDKLTDKEDFYFIQIISRKKDGNNKSVKFIKSFYIYDKEQFLNYKNDIIKLCKDNNARSYFWVNPRNYYQVALECIKLHTDSIIQKNCSKGFKIWDKACGLINNNNYDKLWIVDIDNKDYMYIDSIIDTINNCQGKYPKKVVDVIDTLQGVHLITTPFNLKQFKETCKDLIDIHKDNPTLLYYENNESN